MNEDDDEYSFIEEIMHYITLIFLGLITITFLAGVAGFIWAYI